MSEEERTEGAEAEKAKPGIMRKILKVLLWTVSCLLVVVVLAAVSSPLWLGPLAKKVATVMVTNKTGCELRIDDISINPLTGRLCVKECHLKNPEGYKKEEAFAVSNLLVEVSMGTILSDEIHVKTIQINGLYASYLSDIKGVSNFDCIIAVMSGKKPGEEEPEKEKEDDDGKGPKVVIDHFELTDSEVSYGVFGAPPITLSLPSVKLDDIGKDGKSNIAQAGDVIWQACLSVAGPAGEQVKQLCGKLKDGAAALGNAAGNLAGSAVETIGDVTGKAVDTIGDVTGKAVDTVGDVAGKAVDTIGGAAGKAKDAAGNAVKSIGNFLKGDDK